MANNMQKRLDWIDYGKGICMLFVILSHTWSYYVQQRSDLINILQPTRMFVFFFISGYLVKVETFNIEKFLRSISQKLLFPYFIFTTLIWIPKALAHGDVVSLESMIYNIGGGYASWFVAALAVSKLVLALILYFTKSLKTIVSICVVLFIVGCCMAQYIDADIPWFADYGLISLIYLAMGMTYRRYEDILSKHMKLQVILSILVYFTFTLLDYTIFKNSTYLYSLSYGNVTFDGVLSFFFLSVLGIWMMISIVKILPSNMKSISYVGSNSLVYYYLNTGLLTIICVFCNRLGLGYNGNDILAILIFVVVVIILTITTKLINQYAPWMVGTFTINIRK